MANLKENMSLITNWLDEALGCLLVYVKNGDANSAGLLAVDIKMVIGNHLDALKAFLPDKALKPIPGNFFKKIAWLASNLSYLTILIALSSGVNPFEEAKEEAKRIAAKWGFYSKVYGDN